MKWEKKMRNFFEYVEKGKEETAGFDSVDVLFEGFSQDLMRMEDLSAKHAFIVGFLTGSGIDIKDNKIQIKRILDNEEITTVSDILKNLHLNDDEDSLSLKKMLTKGLTQLKSLFMTPKK